MREVIKMLFPVAPSLGMFSRAYLPAGFARLVSTQTSPLAKLRKTTGYSMSHCKKALQFYPGDIAKAEQWLHAEAQKSGWTKMQNLQKRPATQGLVGICTQDNSAAMVEVNCESDFVARNSEFQTFVRKVLGACVNHALSQTFNQDFTKIHLNSEQLNSLKFENLSLAELVAMACLKFGENTILKRATCIRTKGDVILSTFVHPAQPLPDLPGVEIGRFGALLAYQQKISASQPIDKQLLLDLGSKVCRHIVGMNPRSLGEFTVEDLNTLQKKQQDGDVAECDTSDEESSSLKEEVPTVDEDSDTSDEEDRKEIAREQKCLHANESRLLHQAFLLDTSQVVGEALAQLSLEIIDFERFECGENVDN